MARQGAAETHNHCPTIGNEPRYCEDSYILLKGEQLSVIRKPVYLFVIVFIPFFFVVIRAKYCNYSRCDDFSHDFVFNDLLI